MFVWLPVQYAFDFFFMQMVDMFPSVLRNFILDPCLTPFLEMFAQEFWRNPFGHKTRQFNPRFGGVYLVVLPEIQSWDDIVW